MWAPMMAFLPLLTAMRLDPERIAARLRIEESMDSSIRSDRGRRQLQPKEINIQVTAPLFSSRLFEFGKDTDDTEVPQSLDVGKKVQLTNPLNYYGEDHNTLYILSNGAIGFEANSRSYKANLFPNGARLIAPFWNRNDLRNGGHVYYREVTKGRVLERGQSEIRYQYDKSVKVKSAVVVTWEKMQPLGAAALPEENTNTFQAALFITDNGTYANFIYSNVGWTQGAEAGFNRGDGSAHYALPTSGTGNIMYLEEYGNTGIPGEWMFELGKERVIRCKVGIKGDTCDEECSPGEWGADCALCCHCMEGTCQPLTGECNRECAECWMGNNCQIKKENCHARASAQCAPNAISFTDYDRCGEPLQRCQCLSGFSGDGYKSCHDIDECHEKICHERAICTNTPGRFFCQCQEGFSGDGISECVASFLFPSDGHQPLPKSKAAKVAWQLKNPIEIFGTLQDKLIITSSGLISLSDITRTSGEHLEEMHMTGIAPFFAPIDTSKSGHVTVAEVTDTDTLNRLTRTISENYPDLLFQTKNALIVTHINVTDGKSQKGNTFQTLIVSGTNKKRDRLTFVELLYKDMTWGDGAEAGIITNDLSGSVTLPGSGTQGIEQLTQLSNIKQPGIWLFRIDEPIISPCPKSNQLPPYCEETHSTSTEGLTKSIQKLPSPSLSPSPSFQPHSASSPHPAILSENLDHRSEDLTIGVPVGEPKIIQPNIIPNFPNMQTSFATAAVEKTTFKSSRPRPRFESTSHRPIVSLVDKDFEEIDPDVFEITFPPFVTVIPEIFTPQRRKEATTSRALPDFTLAQQLQSTMRSSPTTTSELTFPTLNNDSLEETILNAPQTKYQHQLETTTELDKSTESMTTTFEHEEENDVEEETESTEVTAIPTSKTSYKEIHEELVVTPEVTSVATTSNQPIFVFTTSKPIPKSIPKKPQIVTAPTTTTSSNVSEAETAASKMAIIIPSAIVMTWILLLIGIALFICCKRRSSRGHLHAGYGPTFTVQPTSYALKRGSKHLDSSYEDHLEKAARLSSEMTAYNQSGRLSLYGSYWNLNNSPNSDPSSSHRRSPLFSGYKPSRYSYTGRY